LIEIVVALSAGVLVSMAAFMLSKSATSFFQRETRVSTAQLALTLAMNRLTGDIQRASLLSSPNANLDPGVCRAAGWPTGLIALTGLTISAGTATTEGNLQTPAMVAPDQIIIGGSMDTSESFQVQSIVNGVGGPLLIMRLPTAEPATYRASATVGCNPPGPTCANLPCKLKPVFAPNTYPASAPLPPACSPPITSGRFARIYQPETNIQWFGVISSFTLDGNGSINVQLATNPSIPVKGASTCGLGVGDTGGGWLFSVVSRVQYDIRSVVNMTPVPAQYAPILKTSAQQAAVTGDGARTELVRTELDANGVPVPGAFEIVAEYAVDMRFGITVANLIQANNYNATVNTYAFGDPNVYTQSVSNPQRIRAVQVRLSTRARAPDRDTDIPPGPDGRRSRFYLGPNLSPQYARVRTNYANVALPNQGGFALW
jgi:hypothetical protein